MGDPEFTVSIGRKCFQKKKVEAAIAAGKQMRSSSEDHGACNWRLEFVKYHPHLLQCGFPFEKLRWHGETSKEK